MLSIHPRARRALLAAVLPAALAAAALPAAAGASVIDVDVSSINRYEYRGDPGEKNSLIVAEQPDGSRVFTDSVPLRLEQQVPALGRPDRESICRRRTTTTVVCHPEMRIRGIELGDGDDSVSYAHSEGTSIDAGTGNDTVFAGVRSNPLPLPADLHNVVGGLGVDTLTYRLANAPASVSLAGGEGRAGADRLIIVGGIEVLEGTRLNDTLTGSDAATVERFRGLGGNDLITGLNGPDVFDEGASANDADTFNGGGGFDLVDYSRRTNRVDVTLSNVTRDDGETGERDLVDPNVNSVLAGAGNDSLTGGAGFNELSGGAGRDAIRAGDGDDRLVGGSESDVLLAEGGADTVVADDGNPDTIRCGTGTDAVTRDVADFDIAECESQALVGRLAVTPRALRVARGEVARLQLAWAHPRAWRELREITVRLRDAQAVVAEIAIDPKRRRAAADEAALADLIGRRVRVGRARRIVSASLPLRIDRRLAGRRLEVEVEATDAAGNRQLETGAGFVRVAS
jgi:RTX calcium-binding nonapeptide repeat (4 copies)